jgi:hypothetical protein
VTCVECRPLSTPKKSSDELAEILVHSQFLAWWSSGLGGRFFFFFFLCNTLEKQACGVFRETPEK